MPRVPDGYAALRRAEIVTGARSCFAQLGYRGSTVTDLEAATGLTRGTIFRYFPSKAAIFDQVCHEEDLRLRQGYEESVALGSEGYHSLEGMLRAAFAHQVERASADPDGLRVRLELLSLAQTDPELAKVVHNLERERRAWRRRIVQRAADAGLLNHGWTVDQVTDLISLAATGLGIEISYDLPRKTSNTQVVELLTRVIMIGLDADPPRPTSPPRKPS